MSNMEESEGHADGQSSPIGVIKSVFEDFNLTELPEDVYVRMLDIIYSKNSPLVPKLILFRIHRRITP